jgi:hypothetical protein
VLNLRTGDTVIHRVFGVGTVVGFTKVFGKPAVRIKFEVDTANGLVECRSFQLATLVDRIKKVNKA